VNGADLNFIHRYVPATQRGLPTLLLLHGTGGDENDLIPLARQLLPGAALLSPRGQVLENGMPRFFRRLATGIFDLDDLKRRTAELAQFIARAGEAYGIDAPVAFGFSNGANIAASLLLTKPEALNGAILLRAMLPFEPQPLPKLTGKPVLLLSGAEDEMIPAAASQRLAAMLRAAGAGLIYKTVPAGHSLTSDDLEFAVQWLEHLT
jgi:phospholipase/carboxylesterase